MKNQKKCQSYYTGKKETSPKSSFMDKYLRCNKDVDNYQSGPHNNETLVTDLWAGGSKLPKYHCS